MSEAQRGLILTTVLILGFAEFLCRKGAVSRAGATVASLAAVAIAATLFLLQ